MFWTEQLQEKPPKVLVACPTFAGCAYSLAQWAEAYHAFTYPNKGALMVDNSDDNLHFSHLVRAQGIPCIYQTKRFNFLWDTLELSWRTIVTYAFQNGYDLIASIEADVICPPNTLEVLVSEWDKAGRKAVVAHRYHPRGIDNIVNGASPTPTQMERAKAECWFDTLGCTLFPTRLVYDAINEWKAIFEVELYLLATDNGYQRVRLRDRLDIKHLDDPERGTVVAMGLPPNTDRAHPGVANVIRPIARGEAASIPRPLSEVPNGSPVDCQWHGRRDISEQTVEAPDSPQQARDALKWSALGVAEGESLEEENRKLRLLANQLFGEVARLKAESCA